MVMFEDFNNKILEAVRINRWANGHQGRYLDTKRILRYKNGQFFAWRSRKLEQLSVSFMIDARHFFNSCKASFTWPRLKSLMLTTPVMTRGDPEKVLMLLGDAALVAQRMPRLEIMAIWHCSGKKACVAIFRRNQRSVARTGATLTWRGSEHLDLSREVVEKWQKVIGDEPLLVRNERVDGDIDSHGDAIHHLGLPEGIIDPRSLGQIRKEGELQKVTWQPREEVIPPEGWGNPVEIAEEDVNGVGDESLDN
ncbi:hypothetical protein ACHAPU_010952 [Fusarium lateritium]